MIVYLFKEPISIVVPIVYNTTANQTSLASLQRELNGPVLHAVQQHLMRWSASNMNPGTKLHNYNLYINMLVNSFEVSSIIMCYLDFCFEEKL